MHAVRLARERSSTCHTADVPRRQYRREGRLLTLERCQQRPTDWPQLCTSAATLARANEEGMMNLGLRSLLLLVAVICFVLAAIGFNLGDITLVPLGLAFFAGASLLGESGFKLRT